MGTIKKVLLTANNLEEEEIKKLVLALEENECEVVISEIVNRDCKIEKLDDESIHEEVENCEIVFVLIGAEEKENICLEKQIEEAAGQEKKIVGIFMGGGRADCIPDGLETYGDGLITYDITKIIKVLEEIQIPWETPEGEPRKQKNTIDKRDC